MANIELHEMEHGKHIALQNIEAATKNIFGIYDDLSYLTKKDKIEYPKQKIILNDFIQSRIAFFDIVAKQSNLNFDIIHKNENIVLYMNETKLQRIIDNNITNAIKYTHEGKILHILLFETKEEICFEISSKSTMIEDPEHIFDAYYREDHIEDGLGLGLNLVRHICNTEGIHIELNSSEADTSFAYYFPKEKQ